MDQETSKIVEKLTPQQVDEALKELDFKSLQAAASVVSQIGFQHFNLSTDTRLPMEARKAHRFVAVNCEAAARKVLSLCPTITPEQVQEVLMGIGAQVRLYNDVKLARGGHLKTVSETAQ